MEDLSLWEENEPEDDGAAAGPAGEELAGQELVLNIVYGVPYSGAEETAYKMYCRAMQDDWDAFYVVDMSVVKDTNNALAPLMGVEPKNVIVTLNSQRACLLFLNMTFKGLKMVNLLMKPLVGRRIIIHSTEDLHIESSYTTYVRPIPLGEFRGLLGQKCKSAARTDLVKTEASYIWNISRGLKQLALSLLDEFLETGIIDKDKIEHEVRGCITEIVERYKNYSDVEGGWKDLVGYKFVAMN